MDTRLIQAAARFLEDQATLPSATERAAIAISKEKTAALIYDRIWSPFETIVPPKVRFSSATILEVHALASFLEQAKGDLLQVQENYETYANYILNSSISQVEINLIPASEADNDQETITIPLEMRPFTRALAEEYYSQYGLYVVPVYPSQSARDKEYKSGQYEVIVSILSNLQIPDERNLSWEQVLEFRNDPESRKKLKRLLHWLDKDMINKPLTLIQEEINGKLDDYQEALKKHGIKTILGTIIGTFGTFIGTDLAQLAPLLQGIFIGGVIVARLVLGHIDKPSPPEEISWVYETKTKLNQV